MSRKNNPVSVTEKRCRTCGEVKPAESFYRHRHRSDGLFGRCKDCHRTAMLEKYHAQQDGTWEPARSGPPRTSAKAKARRKLKYAVQSGAVTPADACEHCGHDFSEYRRDAHHPDYERPLDVVWLCQPCHISEHPSEKAVAFLRTRGITLTR